MKRLLSLFAALALIFAACSPKKTEEKAVQTVKTETVQAYAGKSVSTFPGKVKAASDINLAFRISGPVAKIGVDVGSMVKKGQVLAEMDARDYTIQLSATEAEYNRIKAEAGRVIALYAKGSVAPNDYDKAVYGLQQITAKYEAHKNALNDTKLIAPFDGYIQNIHFHTGETVGAGMPVISIISANLPEVEINIPSSDFIRRDRFVSFSCNVDIYPDTTFPLELIGVAQKANLNQLYTVRLKMKERTPQMPSPGMTTMVTVVYRTEETALVSIPYSAIFETESGSGAGVWVYNSNTQTVESRDITLAKILANGTVLVSEGLKAGETVVTAGIHVLQQGEKVKLLPPVSPTNAGGLL